MTWTRQYELRDPALVYERIEEEEQRQYASSRAGKAEKARAGIESIFARERMGRKLELPGHVATAMYQWGQWARRPQFWANLSVTPFCKLVGIGGGRAQVDIPLDPQSMAIHKAVMRTDEKTKAVLYAYYVACETWRQHSDLFERHGISEDTFHRRLKTGSISVVNAANLT